MNHKLFIDDQPVASFSSIEELFLAVRWCEELKVVWQVSSEDYYQMSPLLDEQWDYELGWV